MNSILRLGFSTSCILFILIMKCCDTKKRLMKWLQFCSNEQNVKLEVNEKTEMGFSINYVFHVNNKMMWCQKKNERNDCTVIIINEMLKLFLWLVSLSVLIVHIC